MTDAGRLVLDLERTWAEVLGVSPVVLVLAPLPDPLKRLGVNRHPHKRLGTVLKLLGRRAGWKVMAWPDLFPSPVMWGCGEGI